MRAPRKYNGSMVIEAMKGKRGKFTVNQVNNIMISKGFDICDTSCRTYLNKFSQIGIIEKNLYSKTNVSFDFTRGFKERFDAHEKAHRWTIAENRRLALVKRGVVPRNRTDKPMKRTDDNGNKIINWGDRIIGNPGEILVMRSPI